MATSKKTPAAKGAASDSPKKAAPKAKSHATSKKSAAQPTHAADLPHIDTGAAANAAAAMVMNRSNLPSAAAVPSAAAAPESATFKQLKESINKPSPSLGGLLRGGPQSKKSNQPHQFGNQAARGQRFGADVNRSGVPRRTSG